VITSRRVPRTRGRTRSCSREAVGVPAPHHPDRATAQGAHRTPRPDYRGAARTPRRADAGAGEDRVGVDKDPRNTMKGMLREGILRRIDDQG
jgi:hypothetical protein